MAILAKPGTWALSRIVVDDGGGFTTAAMEQRLAPTVENYYPPMLADYSGYTLPVALVRLVGAVGTPDASTWLLPPLTTTLRQLTNAQRNAARSLLDGRLTGYSFRDWDGATVVKAAWRSADLSLDSPISAIVTLIFEHLAHSEYRARPATPESHNTEHSDTFDADSSANWTNDGGASYSRNATDGELQQNNWDNDSRLRYSAATPGSIEHEAQATYKVASGIRSTLSGARMYGTGDDAYGAHTAGGDTNLQVSRFNAGVRTALTGHTLSPALDANDWGTIRIACSGAAGANVVIDHWVQDHGATKPADPGWIGVDGSPTYTQTDSSVDRLDDTTHTSTGFAGRGGVSADTVRRMDFWKSRAISDRGGGGAITGSIATAVTVSGVLTGAGALVGSIALALTPTGTLAGTGALSGNIQIESAVSGVLAGSGALSGNIPLALDAAGTLTGAGALIGAVPLEFTPAGTLTGAGALSGAVPLELSVSGTLAGLDQGAIIGSVPLGLSVTGALTGTGALLGSVSSAFGLTGALIDLTPPVAPPVEVTGGGGGGGRIYWQGKRRKRTLEEQPNLHLKQILNTVVAEYYQDLTDDDIPQEVQKQAAQIVKPFAEKRAQKQAVPTASRIDWTAMKRDSERVRQLIALWERAAREAAIEEEDEQLLLLS